LFGTVGEDAYGIDCRIGKCVAKQVKGVKTGATLLVFKKELVDYPHPMNGIHKGSAEDVEIVPFRPVGIVVFPKGCCNRKVEIATIRAWPIDLGSLSY
jgi:hypothetical protein